jgi:hypothetical protein
VGYAVHAREGRITYRQALILAWQEELCRPREGGDFRCPVYYKKTKGWVNAYYLLTSDGVRLGETQSYPFSLCPSS